MTGYGRGEIDHGGAKFCVELNSVNRKQSDIVVNLPRDLAELEPRIRQAVNLEISRGRTNVVVSFHQGSNGARALALDTALARSYAEAMHALQKDLNAPGEITINTILQAPGVMRQPEENLDANKAWPAIERALHTALAELVKMREREGKHLAKDLIHRLKLMRKELKEVRALYRRVLAAWNERSAASLRTTRPAPTWARCGTCGCCRRKARSCGRSSGWCRLGLRISTRTSTRCG
jgi:uncharacterized protein (TIGR00255 family)